MADMLSIIKKILKELNNPKTLKEPKRNGFSDEEILALGLHPDDVGYKISLISKKLNKKNRLVQDIFLYQPKINS